MAITVVLQQRVHVKPGYTDHFVFTSKWLFAVQLAALKRENVPVENKWCSVGGVITGRAACPPTFPHTLTFNKIGLLF